jgi:hypothetical protein
MQNMSTGNSLYYRESFAGEIVKKWKTRSRGDFNEGLFSFF